MEDGFAALGVGQNQFGGVVGDGEFDQAHIVEERFAAGDVQDVDARGGAIAAVKFDLDLGPVRVAADDFGFDTGVVDVEAGPAAQRARPNPAGEPILRIRFHGYIGVEARVGVAGRHDAEREFAAVKFAFGAGLGPRGGGIGIAGAVVAAFPADGQVIVAEGFEAGIGEQIGAFAIKAGAVDAGEQAARFPEPFVLLTGGIADEAGDDGFDLGGRGEFGELYEGREFGEGIGVAGDG